MSVIGSYPCCNGGLSIDVPERTPAWFKEDCPHCGETVWHRISRFDPQSWIEADFESIFIIDNDKEEIRRRDGRDTEIRISD